MKINSNVSFLLVGLLCSLLRFNWADIEPDQGKHNWQVIDDVIAAWRPRGATVAFRVWPSTRPKGTVVIR